MPSESAHPFDLKLPDLPIIQDRELHDEFLRVYNAIKIVADFATSVIIDQIDSTLVTNPPGRKSVDPGTGQITLDLRMYSVGDIYLTTNAGNPSTLLGYGTWIIFGAGRVLVGHDVADADFDTVEETGGAKTHTLTSGEMPSHTHVQDSHTHTQDAHNHTQDAHNHTQDSHNHTQDSHNHTQDAHNHTQDAHSHTSVSSGSNGAAAIVRTGVSPSTGTVPTDSVVATNQAATATNQATTATNQVTTATNQATTATNQSAVATNQGTVAVNQSTGGGGAHNNLQPYVVVFIWKRTA